MSPDPQRTGTRGPDRIYERAPDAAEAANRPLEPKDPKQPLKQRDEPGGDGPVDPHTRLNTPVGAVDPAADSDPYQAPDPDNEADRASGTTGRGQGSEGR